MRARFLPLLWMLGACGGAAGTTPDAGEAFGPLMRPGDNCLRCHNERGEANSRVWTAAGTVYGATDAGSDEGLEGVEVVLRGTDGGEVVLVTNAAGNFHTAADLGTGFSVRLRYEGRELQMPTPPPAGACNACHSLPPVGGAPGRIFAP